MSQPGLGIDRCLYRILRLVTIPVVVLLLLFNLRRILFTIAAVLAPKKQPASNSGVAQSTDGPTFLVLVPCRDEESMIPGICRSLEALDYPASRYQVVLVDDGSADNTRKQMEACIKDKAGWQVLSLPENKGKASALNEALLQFSFGEIVAVFDADHRPRPDVLRRMAPYFADPRVAGLSGRTLPLNPLASPSAYYATVEGYVHQMATMRGKDRLGLAPALLGSNCAYRRSSLVQCGGFRSGALLEDSDLTLAFYRSGFTVRFAEDVIAYHQVPETVSSYIKQHTRWARGFNDVARQHGFSLLRERRLSWPLRLELAMFAAGYLDRIALLGAGIFAALSHLNRQLFQFPIQALYFALLTPFIQIFSIFIEQRVELGMWLRLPLVPIFFIIDIYSAARAMADTLLGRARAWSTTRRT